MPDLTPIIDTTVRPQDDFFKYVNGKWLEQNPIPDSESRWGTFNVLREAAWEAMRNIYEDAMKLQSEKGSTQQQVGDFYFTGMHFDELKETHLAELRQLLRDIDSITSSSQLSSAIGNINALGISAPWINYVDADHDDGTKHILHFRQAGLTLPNRDYYLEDNEKMQKIRSQYEAFARKVHAALPELAASADELWEKLVHFETAIATVSRPSADLRIVEENYHQTPFADIKATYSALDWEAYASVT